MAQFDLVVLRVIKLIRQVSGSSVQTYSQPLVEDFVNQAFDFVMLKDWWGAYTRWSQVSLDGVTGVITTDLAATDEVITWKDIKMILPATNYKKKLPKLRSGLNPFLLTGTTALYAEPLPASHAQFAKRVIQIWPKTAVDDLAIRYRFRPKATFSSTDEIHLDELMLAYAATYLYLKDDGSVPDMTDDYKNLFDIRYRDLIKAEQGNIEGEIPGVDGYPENNGYMTEWT